MSKKLFSSKAKAMPQFGTEPSSTTSTSQKSDRNRATSFAFGAGSKSDSFDPSAALLSQVKKATATGKIYLESPNVVGYSPYHDRFKEWFKEEEIESLAKSVKEQKQLQPGIAYLNPEHEQDSSQPKYLVIAGGRRLAACQQAGIDYQFTLLNDQPGLENAHELVPTLYALNLQENNQRKDTTDIEKGVSYRKMLGITSGYDTVFASQDELAEAFELSKSKVSKLVRAAGIFDQLPELVELFADRRAIAVGSAYELLASTKNADEDFDAFIARVKAVIAEQKDEIIELADRKKLSFVISELKKAPEFVERKFAIKHDEQQLLKVHVKERGIALNIDHSIAKLPKEQAMQLFSDFYDSLVEQ